MTPPRKNTAGAKGAQPPGMRVTAPARQPKPAATPSKVAAPAAPPAYRPQAKPNAAQPKAAGPSQKARPHAPPVYRPQPAPGVLQTKAALPVPPITHAKTTRPAPVPQPTRKPSRPAAPPAFQPRAVQPKPASHGGASKPFGTTPPAAPPVRPFRSSVINMMAEAGVNALTTALTYSYSTAEALLLDDERAELDDLWTANYRVTKNTSKTVKRQRAAAAAATVKTRLDAMLALPRVTYSTNFKNNHLSDAAVTANTAKNRGEVRNPTPPHNTVFKESYIRGLLVADASAAGKADGEHWLEFRAAYPADGKVSLASRNADGGMTANSTAMYDLRVKYRLTTAAASKRQKTVHAFHIETDDD